MEMDINLDEKSREHLLVEGARFGGLEWQNGELVEKWWPETLVLKCGRGNKMEARPRLCTRGRKQEPTPCQGTGYAKPPCGCVCVKKGKGFGSFTTAVRTGS